MSATFAAQPAQPVFRTYDSRGDAENADGMELAAVVEVRAMQRKLHRPKLVTQISKSAVSPASKPAWWKKCTL